LRRRPRHGLRQGRRWPPSPLPPVAGNAFLSVKDRDKDGAVAVARDLAAPASISTPRAARPRPSEAAGVKVTKLGKISEGARPSALDLLKNGQLQMIVNTAAGMLPARTRTPCGPEAVLRGVYMASTMNAARAAGPGASVPQGTPLTVSSLQEHARCFPRPDSSRTPFPMNYPVLAALRRRRVPPRRRRGEAGRPGRRPFSRRPTQDAHPEQAETGLLPAGILPRRPDAPAADHLPARAFDEELDQAIAGMRRRGQGSGPR
jgi:hypothetical protein